MPKISYLQYYRLAHDLERKEFLYSDSNGHDQKRKLNSSEVSVKPASPIAVRYLTSHALRRVHKNIVYKNNSKR